MTRAATVFLALALVACSQAAPAMSVPMTPHAVDVSSPTQAPADLQYLWIGEAGFWSFEPGGRVGADAEEAWQLTSFGSEQFTVESLVDGGGCTAGESGEYSWTLSPGGNYLQLEPVSDTCEARAAGLNGAFQRIACPRSDIFCLGDLEPGTHAAINFLPMVPVEEWDRDLGAMTYRVPAGWTNPGDHPDEYLIQPQGAGDDEGIYMWSESAIVSEEAPCSPNRDADIARTPAAMAAWVADNPLLKATEPRHTEVGGLSGLTLDAHVRPGSELPCLGDGRPYAPMLVHANATGMQWGFLPGSHKRFYLLDLPAERTLVISIEAADEERFAEIITEADAIVKSIAFPP